RRHGREGGGPLKPRRCSRPACKQAAVHTLTYVYRDSTAVLGPLAAYVEPHCYDLCAAHADRMTVPIGWEVVRLPDGPAEEPADDLEALANAVMEATTPRQGPEPGGQGGGGRRGGNPRGRVSEDLQGIRHPRHGARRARRERGRGRRCRVRPADRRAGPR